MAANSTVCGDMHSPYASTEIPYLLGFWADLLNPKVIIEFGTGLGFCTDVLARAAPNAVIKSFDRFDEPFKLWQARWNLRKHSNVTVKRGDVLEWCAKPFAFDLMWLDAGPTGRMLRAVRQAAARVCDGVVLFEGGLPERDKYGKAWLLDDPMVGSVPFRVISDRFPGMARLQ